MAVQYAGKVKCRQTPMCLKRQLPWATTINNPLGPDERCTASCNRRSLAFDDSEDSPTCLCARRCANIFRTAGRRYTLSHANDRVFSTC
jgi:hypothetical protein